MPYNDNSHSVNSIEDPSEASRLLPHQNRERTLMIDACKVSAVIVAGVTAFVGAYFLVRHLSHGSASTLTPTAIPNDISNLGIQNQSPYLWRLTQASGSSAGCTQNGKPATCYSELSQLAQEWVGIQQTTGWEDLEYDVFDASNNYIGHFGIRLTPAAVTVSNQQGVQIVINPYQNGQAQKISVTPNNAPTNNPANCVINHNASQTNNSLKPGVVQSGFEWGNTVSEIDPPTCADIDTAYDKGFFSLRIPIRLEYLSTDGMTINPNTTYVQQILAQANAAISHGGEVIVEPHNYMQFNGQPITPTQCRQLIGTAFVGLFKELNFQNIVIEAMNEPPDNVTPAQLVACYRELIPAARAQGYQGPIIIEGNTWATPSVLTNTDGTPSPLFTALQPLLTNTTAYGDVQLAVHCYFNGATGGGNGLGECIPASTALSVNRIPQLTTLAAQNGIKIRVTEIGVIESNNCVQVLNNTINHFKQNPHVYKGYNWWVQTPSDPSAWSANGYPLLLNLTGSDPRYTVLKKAMDDNNGANKKQHTQHNTFNAINKPPTQRNIFNHPAVPSSETQRGNDSLYAMRRPMTSDVSRVEPSVIFSFPAKAAHTLFGAAKNMANRAFNHVLDSMLNYAAKVGEECPGYFPKDNLNPWNKSVKSGSVEEGLNVTVGHETAAGYITTPSVQKLTM